VVVRRLWRQLNAAFGLAIVAKRLKKGHFQPLCTILLFLENLFGISRFLSIFAVR
jgi:hypothetical protein